MGLSKIVTVTGIYIFLASNKKEKRNANWNNFGLDEKKKF